jgi:hypothetical protein
VPMRLEQVFSAVPVLNGRVQPQLPTCKHGGNRSMMRLRLT